jgi:hypothetical protein
VPTTDAFFITAGTGEQGNALEHSRDIQTASSVLITTKERWQAEVRTVSSRFGTSPPVIVMLCGVIRAGSIPFFYGMAKARLQNKVCRTRHFPPRLSLARPTAKTSSSRPVTMALSSYGICNSEFASRRSLDIPDTCRVSNC